MTRPVPRWALHLAVALAAGLVGACVGIIIAPVPEPTLEYCNLEGNTIHGTPPCPPETNTLVWAAWTPGIRVPATWDGRHWRLSTPVMGISSTTVPPIAWGEL